VAGAADSTKTTGSCSGLKSAGRSTRTCCSTAKRYIANEPSPSTVASFVGVEDSPVYLWSVTVAGGVARMSFQYASAFPANASVYDGPNLTGTLLATFDLPPAGVCGTNGILECGDPFGQLGLWKNVTVPLGAPPGGARAGGAVVARSVGVVGSFLMVDDMVIDLASPPTTKAPTTKAPIKRPTATRSPTQDCLPKGMKGNAKRCMVTMKMKKPKAA
jgi:hypothetical protein